MNDAVVNTALIVDDIEAVDDDFLIIITYGIDGLGWRNPTHQIKKTSFIWDTFVMFVDLQSSLQAVQNEQSWIISHFCQAFLFQMIHLPYFFPNRHYFFQ